MIKVLIKQLSLLTVLGLLLFILPQSVSAVTFVSGNMTQDTTWKPQNGPYVIGDAFVLQNGVTLTIQPGTVVKFNPNVILTPQFLGVVTAVGQANKKITWTSLYDDSVGGDTNGDGAATTPTNSDWKATFDSTVPTNPEPHPYFTFTNLRYMNRMEVFREKVEFYDSTLKFSNNGFYVGNLGKMRLFSLNVSNVGTVILAEGTADVEIDYGEYNLSSAVNDGFLLLDGANLNVENANIINNPSSRAVLVSFGSTATINSSFLKDNAGQGLLVFDGLSTTLPSNLSMFHTSIKNMGKEGILAFDGSSLDLDVVELVNLPLLGIGLFDSQADLQQVSLKNGDDSGIVMFDSFTLPQTSTLTASDLFIDRFNGAGILSFDSKATITNSIFQRNNIGLQVFMGARPASEETFDVQGSNIYNNQTGVTVDSLFPTDPTYHVNAVKNYWLSEKGPFHPTQNCHGQGNSVSDHVLFSPFELSANYQGGWGYADPSGCPGSLMSRLSDQLPVGFVPEKLPAGAYDKYVINSPVTATKESAEAYRQKMLELKTQKEQMIQRLLTR